MNRLFATALISIMATVMACAQEIADIQVSYEETSKNWSTDTIQTSRMTLLANARESKYFNDVSLWNDSLSSTPEGKRQLQQILMAACMTQTPEGGISIDMRKGPTKKVHTYIFTNIPNSTLAYYGKFGEDHGYYNEPIDAIEWEICDSTINVMGYECNMATTDYHGRRWTAWFAPELPMPFGPWKLRGLPGLILKAEADNGTCFTADGITQTDRVITPIYSPDNYSLTDRKKALAETEYFYNNSESIIKAKYGANVQFAYDYADRPKYDAQKYALEPDYKE